MTSGIDEIESIRQPSADTLELWVYEQGAAWAVYRVKLGDPGVLLPVERGHYGAYVDPEVAGMPRSVEDRSSPPSGDPRLAALPSLRQEHVVSFAAPNLGSARILELERGKGAEVVVALRIGSAPERVYATGAVVESVGAAVELEPGYVDMSVTAVCAPRPGNRCIPFSGIGIQFSLAPEGGDPKGESVVVHLKDGVG